MRRSRRLNSPPGRRRIPTSGELAGEKNERKWVRGHREYAPNDAYPSHRKITPEQILAAFNVRAFRREPPGDQQLMLQFIARAIAFNEPIPFIMYWGKGPRPAVAKPDIACIAFLDGMLDRVRDVYAHGAKLKLLFTDTHALLNGHAPDAVRAYFDEIGRLCARTRHRVMLAR